MKDLLVVTPSRRPHNVERLLEVMGKTCRAGTDLAIGVDTTDPLQDKYPAGAHYVYRDGLQRKVVEWINFLAMEGTLGGYGAVGQYGDDCVPLTDGWDERMLQALERAPFAYGNDLSIERPAGALCTHLFMRASTLKDLGYFGPPSIQHMWVDLAWMAWGAAVGMIYLDGVVIEHRHFLEQKAEFDACYQLSRQLVDQDLRNLYAYVRDDLNTDLQKLKPGVPHVSVRDFVMGCNMRGTPITVPPEFAELVA